MLPLRSSAPLVGADWHALARTRPLQPFLRLRHRRERHRLDPRRVEHERQSVPKSISRHSGRIFGPTNVRPNGRRHSRQSERRRLALRGRWLTRWFSSFRAFVIYWVLGPVGIPISSEMAGRLPEPIKDVEDVPEDKLRQVLADTLSSQSCKVCLTNRATVVILPCAHLVSCPSCVKRLRDCPLCRANAERALEIFITWFKQSDNCTCLHAAVNYAARYLTKQKRSIQNLVIFVLHFFFSSSENPTARMELIVSILYFRISDNWLCFERILSYLVTQLPILVTRLPFFKKWNPVIKFGLVT